MRSLKKRGPHVLDDLNDLLFSLHLSLTLNFDLGIQCIYQKSTISHWLLLFSFFLLLLSE